MQENSTTYWKYPRITNTVLSRNSKLNMLKPNESIIIKVTSQNSLIVLKVASTFRNTKMQIINEQLEMKLPAIENLIALLM